VRLCDLNLGEGREQITFRGTKNGEDVTAALNPTAVAILKDYLSWRGKLADREAPLFLTYRRKPYADNGRAYGGQNKTAFKAARRRAIAAIRDEAEANSARLSALGKEQAAESVRDQAHADAVLLGRVTQHWFRHLLATRLLRQDPRAAMEQGGWLDIRSVIGYAQDVPAHRRQLVADMDDLADVPARRKRGPDARQQ
jgi:integrase